jgi:trehalose-6-phosphate synthase
MSNVFVVSNRLPFNVEKDTNDSWTFHKSAGGLVTALMALKQDVMFTWLGWLGNLLTMQYGE